MKSSTELRLVLLNCLDPNVRNLGDRANKILRGWRLSGPGPARFGWWSISPTGMASFLGRTKQAVINRVLVCESLLQMLPNYVMHS